MRPYARLLAVAVVAVVITLAATPARTAESAPTKKKTLDAKLVKRGGYLARIGGCNDCHTPVKLDPELGMPVPDMERAFSGHPEGAPDPAAPYTKPDIGNIGATFTSFALPFGIVYAANITSDPTTGIGSWKEEAFVKAMRTGRHAGVGRPILPPMPWFNLSSATDDDLRAMYAYFMSTKPVKNAVPKPKVSPEVIDQFAAAYEKMAAHGAAPQAPGGSKAP